MKRQLYLYLFILSSLIASFTYMYFSKQLNFVQKNNAADTKRMKDSIVLLSNQLVDADYFSLERNDNAQNYLSDYDVQKLIPKIKDQLLNFNDGKEGNPYTGQEKMGEQKFIINKIKVLNHRWIIADYSDGQLWGEALIKYFIEQDERITFQTVETFIYPKQNY